MSTEESKAFARHQIEELWNKGNLDAPTSSSPLSSWATIRPAPRRYAAPKGSSKTSPRSARPSPISMQIVDQVAEEDRVVTLCEHWHPKGRTDRHPPDQQAG